MIVEIGLTALIITLSWLSYTFWLKPQKIMKNYAVQLERMGYKVLLRKYHPFKHDLIETIK